MIMASKQRLVRYINNERFKTLCCSSTALNLFNAWGYLCILQVLLAGVTSVGKIGSD